jgi:predicted glycosyltransferase
VLDAQPDSRVVARCIDRSTLLEAIRTFMPDIAIFDISPFLGFESCVGEELEAVEECLSYLATDEYRSRILVDSTGTRTMRRSLKSSLTRKGSACHREKVRGAILSDSTQYGRRLRGGRI